MAQKTVSVLLRDKIKKRIKKLLIKILNIFFTALQFVSKNFFSA